MAITGTYTIADLSANAFATTTVQEFGMDNLNAAIQADLAMHNQRTTEMLAELAEPTTERSTIYGTNADGDMVPKDEFTRAATQKVNRGGKVEFPLDGFQFAVGWTADYLRSATVQDMALRQISARQAHLRRLQKDIKNALFGSTNYTWTDRLEDSNDLAVKRLVNADSSAIPNGPNGETFTASSHTHYDAIDWSAADAAAKAAAIAALVQDVVEHGHGADVRVYINRAQEADFRSLTGFSALLVPNIVAAPGGTANVGVGTLDISKADNRLIGYFNGFPVWTKPWVPASYVLAFSAGDSRKPLRFRQSKKPSEQGLYLAGEIITHPLQAQYMEAKHGFGVFTRTNGAVLYLGGGTYTDPSF
jgi:hypothetical protein